MTTQQLLFSLLRAELCDAPIDDAVKSTLTEQTLCAVFELSKKHDLAHIAGQALSKAGVLGDDEISRKFKAVTKQAVQRYVRMSHACGQIFRVLEQADIPFIPLKGAVIRKLYPEPWLRTSCDIDVLVHEADLDRTIGVLVSELGYTNEGRNFHDVLLLDPSGLHVELHFTLLEEDRFHAGHELLEAVWQYTVPVKENSAQQQLSDEMFYFYHILHMATHFYYGGCGIRPLLDLWLLNRKVTFDPEKREALLKESGLLTFEKAAVKLSEVWLSGDAHTELTAKTEEYILSGGVYGTVSNRTAVLQSQKGSRAKFLLSRIFLPYGSLKGQFPILQKHKWLLPFCQVHRWLRLLRFDRFKQAVQETTGSLTLSREECASADALLKQLGI